MYKRKKEAEVSFSFFFFYLFIFSSSFSFFSSYLGPSQLVEQQILIQPRPYFPQ